MRIIENKKTAETLGTAYRFAAFDMGENYFWIFSLLMNEKIWGISPCLGIVPFRCSPDSYSLRRQIVLPKENLSTLTAFIHKAVFSKIGTKDEVSFNLRTTSLKKRKLRPDEEFRTIITASYVRDEDDDLSITLEVKEGVFNTKTCKFVSTKSCDDFLALDETQSQKLLFYLREMVLKMKTYLNDIERKKEEAKEKRKK